MQIIEFWVIQEGRLPQSRDVENLKSDIELNTIKKYIFIVI